MYQPIQLFDFLALGENGTEWMECFTLIEIIVVGYCVTRYCSMQTCRKKKISLDSHIRFIIQYREVVEKCWLSQVLKWVPVCAVPSVSENIHLPFVIWSPTDMSVTYCTSSSHISRGPTASMRTNCFRCESLCVRSVFLIACMY